MDVGTADAEAFFDKGVLPAFPDGEIGIGVGDIVKIPANKGGMRASVQFCPYLFGLVSPQAECVAELFGDGAGGHEDAVIHILDDLDVVEVLAFEEDGLKVGGKYPDSVLACEDIGGDEAFHGRDLFFLGIPYKERICERIPGKNDHTALV
jgi:hypothetical protein